ncbi:hypothetical protein B0T14DRAFT_508342 [Immersiella caudata]|uniref:CN hydrolase domain-containing protein n=1 Tax=Immersiella caudata TaxID=314043 RepID=A0AA40CE49_9PEZI|nr:hypothetical protein B0T14DRAFT_508342 [Immersiella caudata]
MAACAGARECDCVVFGNSAGVDGNQLKNGYRRAMVVDPSGEISVECEKLSENAALTICTRGWIGSGARLRRGDLVREKGETKGVA